MPGKRITQRQESLYMSKRQQGHSQVTSAAKADISERSGLRIEKGERKSLPTEHNWSTRQDPLETVLGKELVPLFVNHHRKVDHKRHPKVDHLKQKITPIFAHFSKQIFSAV